MSKSRIELINEDAIVKLLQKIFTEKTEDKEVNRAPYGLKLVGGAVIDLLEGRKPKDYDFIGGGEAFKKKLLENGFKFEYKTKYSTTFMKGKTIIQILSRQPQDFEFLISQANYEIRTNKLDVDELSFTNKLLIPITFDDGTRALNALVRKVHWENKGYTMPNKTYLSLLNVVAKSKIQKGS